MQVQSVTLFNIVDQFDVIIDQIPDLAIFLGFHVLVVLGGDLENRCLLAKSGGLQPQP